MEDIEEVMKLFPRGGTRVKKLLVVKAMSGPCADASKLIQLFIYVLPSENTVETYSDPTGFLYGRPKQIEKSSNIICVFGPVPEDEWAHKWLHKGPWCGDFDNLCRARRMEIHQSAETEKKRTHALLENY